MDYNKAALELHSKFPGKIAVQSLCECKDRDALSTAYTPGVAEPPRWWPGGRARRRKTRRQPQGPRSGASIRPCPFAVLLNNAFSPLARGIFLCYTTQHSTLMG